MESVLSFKGRLFLLKTSVKSKTAFAPKVENVFNLLITPEAVQLSTPTDKIEQILIKNELKNLFWIFAFMAFDSIETKATLFFHCFSCKYPSAKIGNHVTLAKLQNLVHLYSATGITWRLQGLPYYPKGAELITPKMFLETAAKRNSQSDQNGITTTPAILFVMTQAIANAGFNFTDWKNETNFVADFHFFGLNLLFDSCNGPMYGMVGFRIMCFHLSHAGPQRPRRMLYICGFL